MQKDYWLLLMLLLMSVGVAAQPRSKQRLNFDWTFNQQPIEGAEAPSYDDTDWQTVHLPHDASIYGDFYEDSLNSDRKNGFRPRLKGWYRKQLTLDPSITGKKLFLEFEGIYRDAHVYVNGQEVAHQLNGYQGFMIDITAVVNPGKNLIAVSYDNTDQESSRWYNGEGIYRDVWLHTTAPVHVQPHGTYVTTPVIGPEAATVHLQTEIINESAEAKAITLVSTILDPSGQQVGEQVDVVPVASGEVYTYDQDLTLADPQMWDLDAPNLYEVQTTLKQGGQVLDEYTTTFGIRRVSFDSNQGLLLNGQKVLAKGVNIHHDLGPLGAAAFERGIERRLEGLKRLGCNAIRLAHNPHDEYILDWCDRNGMLVFDEAFDKWEDQFFGEGHAFEDHWRGSLEAFIRRDRNHPSVFLWSVGNETKQQRDPKADFGVPMLKEMVAFIHDLEPSRSVTCGLHPSRRSGAYRSENYYREGPPEMEFYMDVVSTNYREEFWPIDRANYPQLTFILSEAQVGNLGNEWFNFDHETSIGLFYWGGTDYIGESFGWPAKGWPNGIIDWNDHWKPFSYYIHSLYSETPMVHVTAYDPSQETKQYWNEVNLRFQPMFSHWNWKGRDSVRLITFTNGQEVELLVNGTSMGVKQVPKAYYTKDIRAYTADEYDPDHPINTGPALHQELEWIVPYEQGTIEAIARIGGEVVARHQLETTGRAHHIVLEPDRKTLTADGLDLSYLTVRVVDKAGRTVPSAAHDLQFTVSGAGTNAGVSSADVISHERFQADHRRAFQGQALLIIRADWEPGQVQVTAEARGLKGASVTLTVQDHE
jgi:beta-galactosidase